MRVIQGRVQEEAGDKWDEKHSGTVLGLYSKRRAQVLIEGVSKRNGRGVARTPGRLTHIRNI